MGFLFPEYVVMLKPTYTFPASFFCVLTLDLVLNKGRPTNRFERNEKKEGVF